MYTFKGGSQDSLGPEGMYAARGLPGKALCKGGGTEGPPTFHRLGPGNVRGLQAPMNEQGAVCQARGQEGLEAQPWERPVSTWGGGRGGKSPRALSPAHLRQPVRHADEN